MWMIRRIGIAVAVIGAIPIVLLALSFALSAAYGCVINEGFGVCPGSPVSGTVSMLLMGSLLSLVYAMPAYTLLVVWGIIEIINFVRGPQLE